jgi:hypothetical protein
MKAPLGFSVSCYRGDVPLLRGCLASIRAFAPEAPICLFTDGDFPLRRLERAYDLIVIPRSAVRCRALRERSYGYGLTKMVALWEAPFERIIHVDADAVLWGDIRANLPHEPWDFVYNEPHEVITEEIHRQQYFVPELVAPLLEGFQWRDRPYFNSGVFACRVGALSLDRYLKCLDIMEKNYDAIFMDQGVLALMVFKAMDAGLITARQARLQTVVPVVSAAELSRRFRFHHGSPKLEPRPTVIHWAGPKPYILNSHPFSEPMDVFRGQAMRHCGLPRWVPAPLAMRVDELLCRSLPALKQRLRARLKAWLGR